MTFGRVPPLTTPTLTVMPRRRSFIASSVWMTLASSRICAAAVFGSGARMRWRALDEDFEPPDAFASGDDLAAVAGGFGHQHIFRLLSLRLDQRTRRRAADLLVGGKDMGDAKRRLAVRRTELPECVVGDIGAALHVIDAGTKGAIAVDPELQ